MADSVLNPDSKGDTGDTNTGAGHGSPPKAPRWVKFLAIMAIVIVLLVVAVLIASGGKHGPGRHLPGGESPTDHTPPAQRSP